jgi:hypothetical protein
MDNGNWFIVDEVSRMPVNKGSKMKLVLLLGIFRRVPRPAPPGGALVPLYFPGGALPLKKIFFINLNFFFFIYKL